MVVYAAAPGDVETGFGDRLVVLVEKKSSTGPVWKVAGGLFVAALCLGGVLLLAWHWSAKTHLKTQAGHTEALVKNDTGRTDPHSTLRRISSKAKAAIHLEGSCEDDCESPLGRLQWCSGQGQAFAQGGFLVADNRIVVPQTGLYFVYSQASFRVPCGDGGGEEEEEEEEAAARRRRHAPLSHRIWRYSDSLGRKASLMNAVRSACQSGGAREDGQGWYNAIYLGAAFQLQRGDTLWTETNQLAALEAEDGRTFFGVFAL